MRKLLIGILIIALLVLAGYMLVDRVQIADLEILGIEAIVNKNNALDEKILSATKLATVTYQSKIDTLDSANKKLQQEKQAYENYIATDAEGGVVSQIQSYEVEYLWTKIGNYAKREGVVLKMDVEVNNAILGTYNLNFTVAGTYVGITEFIYDLDNDSSLLFKVESFKLVPNSGDSLVATFKCKDISINIDSQSVSGTGSGSDSTNSESSSSSIDAAEDVYNKAQDTIENVDLSEAVKAVHNDKFKAYEGTRISGAKVNALLSTALIHNNSEKEQGTNEYVTVTVKEANKTVSTISSTSTAITKVDTSNYYKVECIYTNEYITAINVTKIN